MRISTYGLLVRLGTGSALLRMHQQVYVCIMYVCICIRGDNISIPPSNRFILSVMYAQPARLLVVLTTASVMSTINQ